MKWLVALAFAVLIGTAVGTNVVNATRSDSTATTRTATTAIASTAVTTSPPATTATTAAPHGVSVQPPVTPSSTSTSRPAGITLAELAVHASSSDCWLAIDGNAYDVTNYLSDHPGGSRTIVPWCGKEASTAFATEDGRGEHSPDAYALLADYLLGPLTNA